MSIDLRRFFLETPKTSEYIFINQETGKPFKSIITAFDGAVVRAGWERGHFTTHALRRTRGQIWDRIDERLSCAALGHDAKVHRKNYTEVKADMLQALVSQADCKDGKKAKVA